MKKGFAITMMTLLLLVLSGAVLSSVTYVSTLHLNKILAESVEDQSVILAEEGDESDEDTSEEGTETTESDELAEQDYYCTEIMHEEGATIINRYRLFLEEYFNLDIDTSEQIANAQLYQRYVEEYLDQIFDTNMDIVENETLGSVIGESLECSKWRDWYKQESTVLLEAYALRSTSSKEVFQIVDGLKTLNEAMEDFSLEFQLTFPLIFKKFDNALPCYAKQCI